MLTRALLAHGDEVLASDPSYLIIHKFIELAGARTGPARHLRRARTA